MIAAGQRSAAGVIVRLTAPGRCNWASTASAVGLILDLVTKDTVIIARKAAGTEPTAG